MKHHNMSVITLHQKQVKKEGNFFITFTNFLIWDKKRVLTFFLNLVANVYYINGVNSRTVEQ